MSTTAKIQLETVADNALYRPQQNNGTTLLKQLIEDGAWPGESDSFGNYLGGDVCPLFEDITLTHASLWSPWRLHGLRGASTEWARSVHGVHTESTQSVHGVYTECTGSGHGAYKDSP